MESRLHGRFFVVFRNSETLKLLNSEPFNYTAQVVEVTDDEVYSK